VKRRNQAILSQLPLTTLVQPQVQIFNLSDALAEFRAQLERDAGVPLQDIETSAALVLDDLCIFLGFSETLRAKVVGREAAAFVEQFIESKICLCEEKAE
jgi:hypothetical protein